MSNRLVPFLNMRYQYGTVVVQMISQGNLRKLNNWFLPYKTKCSLLQLQPLFVIRKQIALNYALRTAANEKYGNEFFVKKPHLLVFIKVSDRVTITSLHKESLPRLLKVFSCVEFKKAIITVSQLLTPQLAVTWDS